MRCTNQQCGRPLAEGARFCTHCGTEVRAAASGSGTAKPNVSKAGPAGAIGGDAGYVEIEQHIDDHSSRSVSHDDHSSHHSQTDDHSVHDSSTNDHSVHTRTGDDLGAGASKKTIHGDVVRAGASKKSVAGDDLGAGGVKNVYVGGKQHHPLFFLVAIVAIVAVTAMVYLGRGGHDTVAAPVLTVVDSGQAPAVVEKTVAKKQAVASLPSRPAPKPVQKTVAAKAAVAPHIAGHSTVSMATGHACLGDHGTRSATREAALIDARRNAVSESQSYLRTRGLTVAGTGATLADSYAGASAKVLDILHEEWQEEAGAGQCLRVEVRAEVTQGEGGTVAAMAPLLDDPAGPLVAKVWTDTSSYREGEKVHVYLKGNKPFYARVVYRDASGTLVQLLPNRYRDENYFQGGMVYEIPGGNDRFDLTVRPPFGEEDIILYASTSPLGRIDVQDAGGVYAIETSYRDLPGRTRGLQVNSTSHGGRTEGAAEFFEGKAALRTAR